MKTCSWLLSAVVFGALLTGCSRSDSAGPSAAATDPVPNPDEPREAQPRLPTVKLWLGPERLTAEVAASQRQIMTGMMFRTNVPEDEGMIFVLGIPQQVHFWMKNCYVPLSVAYIDPEGVIEEIHDMQPQVTNNIDSSAMNVTYALETAQGWFRRHNIHEGVRIRTEHGTLEETFLRRR